VCYYQIAGQNKGSYSAAAYVFQMGPPGIVGAGLLVRDYVLIESS